MAIPSRKAALLTPWNETNQCLSPRCNLNNSKVEEEEEKREGGEESIVLKKTAGLVFGDDDSKDECNE